VLTAAGQAVLAEAQALAKQAAAPATLRTYKADWAHFAAWCDAHGFVPVPADPKTVDAQCRSSFVVSVDPSAFQEGACRPGVSCPRPASDIG
jgi:hypothetical protein